MNITRSTLRTDGLTVGQALDNDASFLRSIGIPAKDGALTIHEQRDEFREKCRKAVLDALDTFADATTASRNDGPKDRELAGSVLIWKCLCQLGYGVGTTLPPSITSLVENAGY